MQRRLAELDSARKQFIANASHELRTPIFSLGGFVELLEDEDPSPEERAEFVRTMRQQIERLTKLTADLLDLSQLDAGAVVMHARSVDLSALAREVTREFGARADLHGSRLELRTPEQPAIARGDPDRVRQIIRILLDNALTHTPEGTKVTVTTYLRQPPRRADRLRRGLGHPPARPEPDLRALLHRRLGRRLRPRPGDRARAGAADGRRDHDQLQPPLHRLHPEPAAAPARRPRGPTRVAAGSGA